MPVIVVTRLRLKDPALLDEFFTDAVAAIEQATKSEGNLGADALADADLEGRAWRPAPGMWRAPVLGLGGGAIVNMLSVTSSTATRSTTPRELEGSGLGADQRCRRRAAPPAARLVFAMRPGSSTRHGA